MPFIIPDPSPISLSPTFSSPRRCRARGRDVALLLGGRIPSFIFNLMFLSLLYLVYFCLHVLLLFSSFSMSFCSVSSSCSYIFLFDVGGGVICKDIWCALRHMVCPQAGVGVICQNIWCALRHMVCPQAGVGVVCQSIWCALRLMVCPRTTMGVGLCLSPSTVSSWLPVGSESSSSSPGPHVPHVPFPLLASPFQVFWAG